MSSKFINEQRYLNNFIKLNQLSLCPGQFFACLFV